MNKDFCFFYLSSSKAHHEQWKDANNLLTIKPSRVMAYACNIETHKILMKGGLMFSSFHMNTYQEDEEVHDV